MNYAEAVGLAVIHVLWQGTLIALMLAAGLALSRRASANRRYLLACGALLLVVVAGVATAVRSYEPASSATPASSANAPAARVINDGDAAMIGGAPIVAPDIEIDLRQYTPHIALLWLAGVLFLTIRLVVSWNRTRSILASAARDAADDLQLIALRLSERLGITRAFRLIETSAVDVPSVIGWLRPVVLVPVSTLTGLTSQQLEMVLAHELAHVRRHDYLVNALQSVAETLLFYHPAVWWISKQIRIERENCCDDLAVLTCGDALQYARALAQLEELRTVPAPALAANGGSLFDRVRRLVSNDGDIPVAVNWIGVLAALIVVATLGAIPVLAVALDEEPEPPAVPVIAVPSAPVVTPIPPRVAVRPTPAVPPRPAPVADPNDADELDIDLDEIDLAPVAAVAPVAKIAATHAVTMAPAIAQAVADGVAGAFAGDIDDDDQEADQEPKRTYAPGQLTIDELIELRIHGVTPEYITRLRSAGLGEVTMRNIVEMKIHDVTPAYIESLRASGVEIKRAKEVVQLKIHGVTPEFVKMLSDAGYRNLTSRELARLAVAGVNADFIREMAKYKK